MQFTSKDLTDTIEFGAILGQLAQPGDVYCLLGDLGAGKTALAQGIGRGLGVLQPINSPTFTLIHEYQGRIPFYHMDLYRMSSWEEGEELGLKEYFWGQGVCAVEWPQVVAELLPQDILQINMTDQLGVRTISLLAHGDRSQQIIEEVTELVAAKH